MYRLNTLNALLTIYCASMALLRIHVRFRRSYLFYIKRTFLISIFFGIADSRAGLLLNRNPGSYCLSNDLDVLLTL